MTAALTLELDAVEHALAHDPPAAGPRGRLTLDDVIVGAWEGLLARRPAACPVCEAALLPQARPAGGSCGDCGTALS